MAIGMCFGLNTGYAINPLAILGRDSSRLSAGGEWESSAPAITGSGCRSSALWSVASSEE
jgi:hypothetical protein